MLIFLDIDGVMVPARGWARPELLKDGFPAFSAKATRALQQLVTPQVVVMLTTSHKSNYTVDEWKQLFEKRGISINHLQTLDNNINNLSRKDEIVHRFNVNPINQAFVIIDDDKGLQALPDFLKQHLILTSPLIGLTEEHVAEAKTILNKGLQPV